MSRGRHSHTASVLKNGNILVTGGFNNGALNSAELYDPSTETWTTIGSMEDEREEHTASVLMNGKVLITGGAIHSFPLDGVELYSSFQTN
jgi:hypothetical protein